MSDENKSENENELLNDQANNNESADPELDLALESLLSDLKVAEESFTPQEQPLESAPIEQQDSIPELTPEFTSAPSTEISETTTPTEALGMSPQMESLPAKGNPFALNPKSEGLKSKNTPKRKKVFLITLILLVVLSLGVALWEYQEQVPMVNKIFVFIQAKLQKPVENKAVMPSASFVLTPVDTNKSLPDSVQVFVLNKSADSVKSASESAKIPEPKAKIDTLSKLESTFVAPSSPWRTMDSTLIREIRGTLAHGRVNFRADLMLFSRSKGLSAQVAPFEDALKAVVLNIFYFTEPRKDKLLEIEHQILQKTGFLIPNGQIIRVSLQNLTMESPP